MERVAIPKNASFTSVTDVILIQEHSSDDHDHHVKVPQHPPSDTSSPVPATSATATKKSVRFGVIDQRIYNRIVGDHPDVRVGPPITFGWEYGVVPSRPIIDEEHEAQPPPQQQRLGVRRMSSITRKNVLRNLFDVSEADILAAEREVQIIQKQRERSAVQSTASAVVESNLRRVGRKLRKSVGQALMAMATLPVGPSYAIPTY